MTQLFSFHESMFLIVLQEYLDYKEQEESDLCDQDEWGAPTKNFFEWMAPEFIRNCSDFTKAHLEWNIHPFREILLYAIYHNPGLAGYYSSDLVPLHYLPLKELLADLVYEYWMDDFIKTLPVVSKNQRQYLEKNEHIFNTTTIKKVDFKWPKGIDFYHVEKGKIFLPY